MNNNYRGREYPGGAQPRQMRQNGYQPEPPRRKRRGLSAKAKVIIAVILVLYAVVLAAVAMFYFAKPEPADPLAVEGEYNILLLGHDKTAMLTDVVMIVNVNANDNSASVMQIPRDTYVTSVDGVTLHSSKVNEMFVRHYNVFKKNGEKDDDAYRHALDEMASLLGESLSLSIDGAAIMDLQGFRNIVDAIGGVEMDVPNDLVYYDDVQGLSINIKAGKQTLSGASAEGFVRFRHDYNQGDLGRVNAQKMFLTAFFNKLKSTVSITNIPTLTKLATEISENVVTTLSLEDMIYFTKCALKLDLDGITMMTMPGQVNSSHYVMNRGVMLKTLNEYFNTRKDDITSEDFDKKGMFNNPSDPGVYELYYAGEDALYGGGQFYGGSDINNEGIDVPMAQ